MHRYKLTSGGYEGATHVTLMHQDQFSSADLQTLIEAQLVAAVERLGNSEPLAGVFISTMDNLFRAVIDLLIEQQGFKREVFTAEFNIFGWRHLDSDGFDEDPETNRLVAVLEEQGMNQAFFKAWEDSKSPLNEYVPNEPNDVYAARLFGASAGGAFRLNEMLDRKAFKTVVPWAHENPAPGTATQDTVPAPE